MDSESLSMPAQHGVWFDDQKRVASSRPGHCRSKEGEDGSVGVGEVWAVDLTLKDEELVAEREDLCVAGVARGEEPSESFDHKANQSRKQGHEQRMVTVSPMPKPAESEGG